MGILEGRCGFDDQVLFHLLFFVGFSASVAYAQTFDDAPLLENAQKFLEGKQYENAIIELNKIL